MKHGSFSVARTALLPLFLLAFAPRAAQSFELTGLGSAQQLAMGGEHVCAGTAQALWCWGRNSNGQLGLGDRAAATYAKPLAALRGNIVAVAAGGRHTCAIRAAELYCWGANEQGQLGTGDLLDRQTPARIDLPGEVRAVGLGINHGCAQLADRSIWCWGSNEAAQTGQSALPANAGSVAAQPLPRRVDANVGGVDAFALGARHTCVLAASQVLCWGDNRSGQLGDGTRTSRPQAQTVALPAVPLRFLDAGHDHTCAATVDGEVWCWGQNYAGQAGADPVLAPQADRPLRVDGTGSRIDGLVLGFAHSCVASAAKLRCWGFDPFDFSRSSPAGLEVADLPADSSLLAGSDAGVCVNSAAGVACAGSVAVTGVGDPIEPLNAVVVEGADGLGETDGGVDLGGNFGCLQADGDGLRCWGNNDRGQLGQGDLVAHSGALAVELPAVDAWSVGRQHACAASAQGIFCWGGNQYGELGDLTRVDRSAPALAHAAPAMPGVEAGDGFTCAFHPAVSASVWCWGRNDRGQLGQPASAEPMLQARELALPAPVESLVAGHQHVCAQLSQSGRVFCWGQIATNAAEASVLATGGRVEFSGPREVVVPQRAALAASAFTACAGNADDLLCWGQDHSRAQDLPRGPIRAPSPVDLPAAARAAVPGAGLALGGRHLCVAAGPMGVQCIGLAGQSCAFDRATGRIQTPGQGISCSARESLLSVAERDWQTVTDLPGLHAARVAAGDEFACAVLDGRLHCWGRNDEGQLGRPVVAVTRQVRPVLREGAVEPEIRLPVGVDPARACPGYYVGLVSLRSPEDPRAAGAWGMQLLLTAGSRLFHGGLNFGGYASADPFVPGFAAFRVQSADGRGQMLNLALGGAGGRFELRVESNLPGQPPRQVVLSEHVELGGDPLKRSVPVADGFHTVVLAWEAGDPRFLVSAGTATLEGGSAAFGDGALVGGYLRAEAEGFAAVCTGDSQDLIIKTDARTDRGPGGSGDLRLRVLDGSDRRVLYDSLDSAP